MSPVGVGVDVDGGSNGLCSGWGGRERREVGWPSVSVMLTIVFRISGVLGVWREDSPPAGTFRPHLSFNLLVGSLLLMVVSGR